MDQLPVFLNLRAKRVVVVGGGLAAARRAEALCRAGAKVDLFARTRGDEMAALCDRRAIAWTQREADRTGDFAAAALCVVATDDDAADERVSALARRAGVLVNVAARADLSDFHLPAILEREPVTIAISTGGASPVLARRIRAHLEANLPSGYGRLATFLRIARPRVREAIADAGQRRRFWDEALDGPIGEMALVGDFDKAERALVDALAATSPHAPRGEVYLVGAGPGDPDLLTLRALRLMQKAEVILYDRLVDARILELCRREAERIYVGKRRGDHALAQEDIGDLLVRLARQGKRVLRLKGGDPFVFGRGGEEIEKLAENRVFFQICPGVTAAIGCSAYAGIPLTHRDHAQACIFLTAHGKDGLIPHDWRALARPGQTVAIYMGLTYLEALAAAMIAAGVDPATPAAIVDNGARANQRVVAGTIATLAEQARAAELRGPTIIIVGSVVTLRGKLGWYGGDAAPTTQNGASPPRQGR